MKEENDVTNVDSVARRDAAESILELKNPTKQSNEIHTPTNENDHSVKEIKINLQVDTNNGKCICVFTQFLQY